MVARAIPTDDDAPANASGAGWRLFTTWRVLLTRFARRLVAAVETLSAGVRSIARITYRATTRGASTLHDGVHGVGGGLVRLFNGWRGLVSRVLSFIRPRERFAAARTVCVDAYALLAHPTSFGSLDACRADRLGALGLRAFVLGSAGSIAIGVMTPGGSGLAIASALNGALWAAARLAILLALAPRDRQSRILTTAAWSASLLPYLFGATDALRWVALGASAYVCYGALSGAGLRRETVRTMTAWAFGGQTGVLAAGWLLRGTLALLASL